MLTQPSTGALHHHTVNSRSILAGQGAIPYIVTYMRTNSYYCKVKLQGKTLYKTPLYSDKIEARLDAANRYKNAVVI
jgi:hypothetical protein